MSLVALNRNYTRKNRDNGLRRIKIVIGHKRRYYKLSQCHNIGRLSNYVVV